MKLTKLSLAAMVALGAFSVSASAVALEEAIKNVDVKGYVQYQYDIKDDKAKHKDSAAHRFKIGTTFKSALDDHFFTKVALEYGQVMDDKPSIDETYTAKSDGSSWKTDIFKAKNIIFGVNVDMLTAMVGRQGVDSFFTNNLVGDGLRVEVAPMEGLTLAGIFFNALDNDGDIVLDAGNKNNLYGVAAVGEFDPVAFQVWYAGVQDIANLFAGELKVDLDLDPAKLGLTAQFGMSSLDSKVKKALKDEKKGIEGGDNGTFFGVQADVEVSGLDANAGYVMLNTGKKKTSAVSFEDKGAFIAPGEEFDLAGNGFTGKNSFFFVGAGYTFADIRGGVDYAQSIEKSDDKDNKVNELLFSVDYKYSKKLAFKTFYSMKTDEPKGGKKAETNKFRFQAKYSF